MARPKLFCIPEDQAYYLTRCPAIKGYVSDTMVPAETVFCISNDERKVDEGILYVPRHQFEHIISSFEMFIRVYTRTADVQKALDAYVGKLTGDQAKLKSMNMKD